MRRSAQSKTINVVSTVYELVGLLVRISPHTMRGNGLAAWQTLHVYHTQSTKNKFYS